jgi:hypothetical protein
LAIGGSETTAGAFLPIGVISPAYTDLRRLSEADCRSEIGQMRLLAGPQQNALSRSACILEREIPTTMPVALAMLATDKSISAHRITNVSPTAIIAVTVPDQQEQRGDDDDACYRPERAGTQGHDQRRHSIGDLSAPQQSR